MNIQEHLFRLVPPPWEKEILRMEQLRNLNPGVALVGECRVCGRPVRRDDEPVPVYDNPENNAPDGFIHGSYDCMDGYDCPVGLVARGEPIRPCVLIDGHVPMAHLWAES